MKTEINGLETYFEWWLKEMQTAGYVKSFERETETFIVAPVSSYGRYKRFKRKEKEIESFSLFPEIKYSYDYKIYWNSTAEYLFYEEINEHKVFQFGRPLFIAYLNKNEKTDQNDDYPIISYVDVKPTNSVQRRGGKVSSSITFPLKNRLLWENSGIYINKVVPMPMSGTGYSSALFIKTFTPQRYLLTDGGKQLRKIKFSVTDLNSFVFKRKTEIETLLKNTI